MRFDEHFPPACPPTTAIPTDRTVIRAVTAHPLDDSDFRTYYENNTEKFEGDCNARGLSVFLSKEDLLRACGRSSALREITKGYAIANLKPHMGKIAQTGQPAKNHFTWWMSADCDRVSCFGDYIELEMQRESV